MNRSDQTRKVEAGIVRVFHSLHEEESVDSTRLLRYIDDPESFSAEERAEIQSALDANPMLGDQARVMRNLDTDALLRAADDAPIPVWTPRLVTSRRRRWLPVSTISAIAAGLALVLLWPGAPDDGPIFRGVVPEETPDPDPILETPTPTPVVPLDRELQYRAPADAEARTRLEGTVKLREDRSLSAYALAPDHVGRTARATPTVFWHLAGALPERGEFRLRLLRAASVEPLIDAVLPRPSRTGVQALSFEALGLELPVGTEYRWAVVYLKNEGAAAHVLTEAWIERVEAPGASDETDDDPWSPVENAAAAGLWYDSFASLQTLGPPPSRSHESLLESAGLEALE